MVAVKFGDDFSFKELESFLRDVTLMKRPDIKIYKNAKIELREFYPEEVNPTTLYLLNRHMEFQKNLRKLLAENGQDTLRMNGCMELIDEDGKTWLLTPPIVELTSRLVQYHPYSNELSYRNVSEIRIPALIDGCHRVTIAKEEKLPFTAVYIKGANEDFPVPVYPNGWDEIEIVDEIPTSVKRKRYATEDNYMHYRNFASLGMGGPRAPNSAKKSF